MIGTILMLLIHLRSLARNGRGEGWMGRGLPLEDLVHVGQVHLDTVLALVSALRQVLESFRLIKFLDYLSTRGN